MIHRSIEFPEQRSFFLFGARGTGKSTLVKARYSADSTLYIDLLLASEEDAYGRDPDLLYRQVKQLPATIETVVIDEVQKLPKLLDIVHKLIFETQLRFVLTGSSARKLRNGSANMLAGRAFERTLHPLTRSELGEAFTLDSVLSWGALPEVVSLKDKDKAEFLKVYGRTYLKEEVWAEHVIRRLEPFRKFLEVAAQHNGKVVNFSSIGKDVGVDPKTIKEYFQILEDTLVGFVLEPYLHSERKRVQKAPKFYFFDLGVCRALSNLLMVPPRPSTSYYGELFEQFFILEMLRREAYFPRDYRYFYLATEKNELDLVIERPGQKLAAVEIKSTTEIRPDKLTGLQAMESAFREVELFCVSKDPRPQKVGNIQILPWEMALETI